MSGCKIGKVTLKNGAALHLLPTPPRSFVGESASHLGEDVDGDTIAVGYFVVQKNRVVKTNWCYEAGITNLDLIGGCEALKIDIIEREIQNNKN